MTDKAPCQVCGVATALNRVEVQGRTAMGQWNPATDLTMGTCLTCQTLQPDEGLAVRATLRLIGKDETAWPAFGAVLADMEIDPTAVLYSVSGSPRQGPQRTAFGHVPKQVKAELRRAWATVLANRVEALTPQPALEPISPPADAPQGCLACGVATAMDWHGPLHTFGLVRGPDPVHGWVCPACAKALEQVGAVGEDFLERAVMAAKGIDWVPRVRAWVATGLPPQAEGWAWMGDLLDTRPLNLDPFSALAEMLERLTDRVEMLENEVAALRGVPVS